MKNQVEFDRIVKTLTQKVKPGHEWQIDLSKELRRYQEYAECSNFGGETSQKKSGGLSGSFVEAGLIVENASAIYSLRVDSAYDEIFKCAESIRKSILNAEKSIAKEKEKEIFKATKVKNKSNNKTDMNHFNILYQMKHSNIKEDDSKRYVFEDDLVSGFKLAPPYLNRNKQDDRTETECANTEFFNAFNEISSYKYDYMMNTNDLIDYEDISDEEKEDEETEEEPERRQSCSGESIATPSLVDSGFGSRCSSLTDVEQRETIKGIFQEFLTYLDDTINNFFASNIASQSDVHHLIESVTPIRKNLENLIENSKDSSSSHDSFFKIGQKSSLFNVNSEGNVVLSNPSSSILPKDLSCFSNSIANANLSQIIFSSTSKENTSESCSKKLPPNEIQSKEKEVAPNKITSIETISKENEQVANKTTSIETIAKEKDQVTYKNSSVESASKENNQLTNKIASNEIVSKENEQQVPNKTGINESILKENEQLANKIASNEIVSKESEQQVINKTETNQSILKENDQLANKTTPNNNQVNKIGTNENLSKENGQQGDKIGSNESEKLTNKFAPNEMVSKESEQANKVATSETMLKRNEQIGEKIISTENNQPSNMQKQSEPNNNKEISITNIFNLPLAVLSEERDFDYSKNMLQNETFGIFQIPQHIISRFEIFDYSNYASMTVNEEILRNDIQQKEANETVSTTEGDGGFGFLKLPLMKLQEEHEYDYSKYRTLKRSKGSPKRAVPEKIARTEVLENVNHDTEDANESNNAEVPNQTQTLTNSTLPVTPELILMDTSDENETNNGAVNVSISAVTPEQNSMEISDETNNVAVSQAQNSINPVSEVAPGQNSVNANGMMKNVSVDFEDSGVWSLGSVFSQESILSDVNRPSQTPLKEILPQLEKVSMLTRLDKDLNEMLLTGKTFDPGYDSLSIIDEGYDENDLLNSTISSQSNSMFSISNESGILCGQEVLMSSTPTKNSSKSATNNQNSAPKDGSLNGPFFERPKSLKEKYCVPDTSMENRIQHWRDMINLKLDIDKSNTYKLKSYRKYLLDCLSKSKENGCTVDDFISSNPDSGYGRFVLAALQLVNERKVELEKSNSKGFDDPGNINLTLCKNRAGSSFISKSFKT